LDEVSIEERVREIAERAAREKKLEVVNVEVAGRGRARAVRVFIDKPEGVTHEDCEAVSRYIGTVLDVEDFIPETYTLEVSSPGLERPLIKREDYERFAGRLAQIKTREVLGNQRNFRGRILGVEGDFVVFEDKTNGRVQIPLETIAKANLEIDLEEEFRRAAREKQ
jgi:ribosome maturation factor RimP